MKKSTLYFALASIAILFTIVAIIDFANKVTASGKPLNQDNISEWEHPYELYDAIKQRVLDDDFESLENMVNLARTKKLRYPNSDWVLVDLYNAIPYAMSTYEQIYRFSNQWKNASPHSNIPYVIDARAFYARAWEIRGKSFAGQLTESEYNGFKDYLQKSWDTISLAEDKGPLDSEMCNLKVELSFILHSNKSLARKAFEECLAIDIGYYPVYFVMLNYLQPKWLGSENEMLAFVNHSSDTTSDIYGEGLYALMVYSLSDNISKLFKKQGGLFSWQKTKSGFQQLLRNYEQSPQMLHRYGYLAMLANDSEAFAEVLAETGTEWDQYKERYYRKKSWYEYHLYRAEQ